jgi:NAD+ kinase
MRIKRGKPADNIFLTVRPDFSGLNEIEESVRRMLSGAGVHIVGDPLEADVIIAIGGDGTFLKAVHESGGNVPVIGVKNGTYGTLMELSHENIAEGLRRIVRGEYFVMIVPSVEVKNLEEKAFNEVLLTNQEKGKSMKVELYVEGERINSFIADGIVAATPIGSWAYSLSLNGPILDPRINAMILAYIAPWSPSSEIPLNPVVVPEGVEITISSDSDMMVVPDGVYRGLTAREATLSLTEEGFMLATLSDDPRYFYRRIIDRIRRKSSELRNL